MHSRSQFSCNYWFNLYVSIYDVYLPVVPWLLANVNQILFNILHLSILFILLKTIFNHFLVVQRNFLAHYLVTFLESLLTTFLKPLPFLLIILLMLWFSLSFILWSPFKLFAIFYVVSPSHITMQYLVSLLILYVSSIVCRYLYIWN